MSASYQALDLRSDASHGLDSAALDVDHSRVCTECASRGKTCCQEHDIYVTWGDCRRIFEQTRQRDFFEYRQCSNAEYADQDDDPLWQQLVFRADGSRRVVKRRANGDCLFLTPSGCTLAITTRPLICRLFPHTYSAAGLDNGWDPECRAAKTTSAAFIEQAIAGIARREAAQWHQLLYREVLLERSEDENWLNL